jgi:hypothetical protein
LNQHSASAAKNQSAQFVAQALSVFWGGGIAKTLDEFGKLPLLFFSQPGSRCGLDRPFSREVSTDKYALSEAKSKRGVTRQRIDDLAAKPFISEALFVTAHARQL